MVTVFKSKRKSRESEVSVRLDIDYMNTKFLSYIYIYIYIIKKNIKMMYSSWRYYQCFSLSNNHEGSTVSQNRCNPVIWWFITEISTMVVFWIMSCKEYILWAWDMKSMLFKLLLYQLSGHANFFWGGGVLVSLINHYHINGLSPNKCWRKIFFLFCPRHCDRGLIVVVVNCFQIWNKNNTTFLLVEILAVIWVPSVLRNPA